MHKFSWVMLLIYCILLIVLLVSLLPVLLLIIVSITDDLTLLKEGVRIFPSKLSFLAYELIFRGSATGLQQSYLNTVLSTLIGTLIAVTITGMAAYTLSNTQVRCRSKLALFFFFTMLFSGGMVPWYIINRSLGIYNNFLALIIPSLLFSPYNMFIVRNYMNSLPSSIRESALIDGANDITIAFRIYMPLSKPVLAAVSLFYALGYWNNWWNVIMLVDKKELFTLQYMLLAIRAHLGALQLTGVSGIRVPSIPMQNAVALITIGPIVFVYPLLQRYFVKGIMIGAIKG